MPLVRPGVCVCVWEIGTREGGEGGRAADLIRCSACRTTNGSAAPSPAAAGGTAVFNEVDKPAERDREA